MSCSEASYFESYKELIQLAGISWHTVSRVQGPPSKRIPKSTETKDMNMQFLKITALDKNPTTEQGMDPGTS
jgi:hypothetical protein